MKYYQAIAVMIGYIIGVGMFGLPFLASGAGLLSFFMLLIILGGVQYLVHLIYSNIIIETKDYHRMPGYTEVYLGKKWKHLNFGAKLIGNIGALLAYIIITGIFLNQLFQPYLGGNEFIYASVLFFIEAIIVLFGIGMIAKAELVMSVLLLAVVSLIMLRGLPHININNYSLIDWKYLFLPYGAMLFALDGNGSLPMVARLVKRDPAWMKKVVRIGTFLPMIVIALFTLTIVGISGSTTTPDALSGISQVLGDGIIFFALIFGVLTMSTSFLGVAEAIRETYAIDYGINQYLSWALAVFIPYILYILGLKNLIEVISFAGAIAGGMSALILVKVFLNMKKRGCKLVLFKHKPGIGVAVLLSCLFIGGLVYEIWAFLGNR